MKFLSFTIWLAFSTFSIQSGNATKYDALVIQKFDNKLSVADASSDVNGLFLQFIGFENLYYLCPQKSKNALHIKTTIHFDYGPAKQICSNEVQPTVLKVTGEFRNDEGKEDIHLYDIGFTVNDDKFKSATRTTQYESIDKDDYFIRMISVYRHKKLQHTIAVRYEILITDIQKKLNKNLAVTYQESSFFSTKLEQFFQDQKSKLTEILGANYIETNHKLVLDTLVNENHFLVDMWKKTTRYKVNQILIWEENFELWRNVQEFFRRISDGVNALITIYAGIGKALIVTGSDKLKYKLEWNQGEETIFIPELYWAAIDYTKTTGPNRDTTGMVVIIHNEPPNVLESNVEKICDTNFCQTNNIWHLMGGAEKMEGRVYCCPLDSITISKLGAHFLLKMRPFFRG